MQSMNDLSRIGFNIVGEWNQSENDLRYNLYDQNVTWLDNILYAFAESDGDSDDGLVKYIGKTTKSMRNRYVGYEKPGNAQQTNRRVHINIKKSLDDGKRVRILLFEDVVHLQWGGFNLNVAAGIEDSLIKAFQAEWNRAGRERPVQTATQEIETEFFGTQDAEVIQRPTVEPLGSQQITLGATYYKTGYMNFNPACSLHLGEHGTVITLYAGDRVLSARIDRNAVPNSSVRVNWGQALARWYQAGYEQGDVITVDVYPNNQVVIR